MDFKVGDVLPGKVTGIMKFGAFVTIAPGKSGLVHISEISGTYVNEVSDYLTEGQEVIVKIISIDQTGRMNLSIKAASAPASAAPETGFRQPAQRRPSQRPPDDISNPSFEDKLKRFMQDSDSKMSDLRQYPDKKGARRRGR